jgi:hypothetical protein
MCVGLSCFPGARCRDGVVARLCLAVLWSLLCCCRGLLSCYIFSLILVALLLLRPVAVLYIFVDTCCSAAVAACCRAIHFAVVSLPRLESSMLGTWCSCGRTR